MVLQLSPLSVSIDVLLVFRFVQIARIAISNNSFISIPTAGECHNALECGEKKNMKENKRQTKLTSSLCDILIALQLNNRKHSNVDIFHTQL